jgi:hypothetical protein
VLWRVVHDQPVCRGGSVVERVRETIIGTVQFNRNQKSANINQVTTIVEPYRRHGRGERIDRSLRQGCIHADHVL